MKYKFRINEKIHNSLFIIRNSKGFSILELILASGIFVLFATGIVIAVIQGYNLNRLGAEFTIANNFAAEGIEAVRSIKNQGYSNLTAVNSSPRGVDRVGNVWQFGADGTNNTFTVGKVYTRVITVGEAQRDNGPPNGNIVASSGSIDPNTKKVLSTVTWDFNSARAESLTLTSYLSDWRKAITSGILIYGDTTSVAQPKFRQYTDSTNTFTTESTTGTSFTDAIAGKTFKIKTSPTRFEAVAGYVNNSGVLRILCFDGTNWSSEWTVTVGGTGTNDQRFGISYETNTGDVLVVYSTNVATTNEMAHRTKAGSTGCGTANWSSAANINASRTTGVVQWIRMESSPASASNRIYLAWADSNSDLSAMGWDGNSWAISEPASTLETDLERVSASQDVQSFDVTVEGTTGNLMIAWSPNGTTCTAGSNCIRYSRYTSSWAASAAVPTVADRATNIDITANLNSNEIILAASDNSSGDLSIAYWSGSAWTGRANVDTSVEAPVAGTKLVATGWLINGSATRSVIVYMDGSGTGISWYVENGSAAPSKQTDFTTTPAIGDPKKWIDIQMDPKNKDRLLTTISDLNSDLFAKKLIMSSSGTFTSPNGWSNTEGGSALEANLGQATTSPFGFAYWKNP